MLSRWICALALFSLLLAVGVAAPIAAQNEESSFLRPFKAPITERLLNPDRLRAERDPWIDDTERTTYRLVSWDDFLLRHKSWSTRGIGLASTVVLDSVTPTVTAGDSGWVAGLEGYRVYSVMNKSASFYRPARRGKQTLAYEQGYFDLAELCARTFRSEVSSIRASGASELEAKAALGSHLLSAYRDVRQRLEQLQELYHFETRGGLDRRERTKWANTLGIALEGEGPTPLCSDAG